MEFNNIIEDIRSKVTLTEREVTNVDSSDIPGTYPGYKDEWNQAKFEKNFRIDIITMTDMYMEFDMIGIDTSLANAFRRILLSEVPTMAIDRIEIFNNTSVIFDEMLSHRIGLVPIKADSRLYQYRNEESTDHTSKDSIVFKLHVKCKKPSKINKLSTNVDQLEKPPSEKVTTKSLVWVPFGDENFEEKNNPRPVETDILLAKLLPGQEIELTAYCYKGIGKDHAKFSPVATAYYRQLPEIKLLKKITGEQAERLKACFDEGVIEIDIIDGEKVARVSNSRNDTLSRNVFRYDDLKNAVSIKLVRNHFIFCVESSGVLPAHVLVSEAIKVLMLKCQYFINELSDL